MSYKATTAGKFIVALLFIIGVGLFGTIIWTWVSSTTRPEAIDKLMELSVFTIDEDGVAATGFFVMKSGYAISASTPFLYDTDFKTMVTLPKTGEQIEVNILAIDLGRDVTILEFPAGDYQAMRLKTDALVMGGDEIVTFQPPVVITGHVAEYDAGGMVVQTEYGMDDAAIGAPIGHRNSNSVIGMVGAEVPGDPNGRRKLIPADAIVEFFISETHQDPTLR